MREETLNFLAELPRDPRWIIAKCRLKAGRCGPKPRGWPAQHSGRLPAGYAGRVSELGDRVEALRLAARPTRSAPAAMASYLEKVRDSAYLVTDDDVDELRAAGFSEDVIFEQTVSAAVAEGLARLDVALRVVA